MRKSESAANSNQYLVTLGVLWFHVNRWVVAALVIPLAGDTRVTAARKSENGLNVRADEREVNPMPPSLSLPVVIRGIRKSGNRTHGIGFGGVVENEPASESGIGGELNMVLGCPRNVRPPESR